MQFSIYIFVFCLVTAGLAHAADIQIYALFNNVVVLDIDNKQYKLRVGESSPEGVKLIAADSEKAVLEIKGKRYTYTLGEKINASFASNQRKAEARIWPNGGLYLIPGSINNQPVKLMIDTGASWVAMNAATARKLGINYRYEGQQGVAGTAGGNVRVFLVKLESVRVGEIELKQVDGAVIDARASDDVLLGASFLNRVDLLREGQMMLLREK
ncbi:MAG: retroviral-like aspartic protease family protein [Gammaproteobacteria bacterium]|nr:retroviral-like aspartic protease family protein [Gammaproteobacteria bacterium]